jgi:dTDP-4-amino-4,6-dideoxygalactose transaminase
MPILVSNNEKAAAQLQKNGIAATPWWSGHNQNLDWAGQESAAYLKSCVLSLPVDQSLGEEQISRIVQRLRQVLA